MITNKSKGFTIIELLVVVAIIAVLAAIVLINVTSYINKGKDAAIKGNLASALIDSAVEFDTAGSYAGFCAAAKWTNISAAVTSAGGTDVTCQGTTTAFCACSKLKTDTTKTYCTDSRGVKVETASSACTGAGGMCLATDLTCGT